MRSAMKADDMRAWRVLLTPLFEYAHTRAGVPSIVSAIDPLNPGAAVDVARPMSAPNRSACERMRPNCHPIARTPADQSRSVRSPVSTKSDTGPSFSRSTAPTPGSAWSRELFACEYEPNTLHVVPPDARRSQVDWMCPTVV